MKMKTHILRSAPLLLVSLLAAAPLHAQAADSAAPARRAVRQSWTADRRAFAVGDVITVLVDESTRASADKDNFATQSRRRDADFVVSGSGAAAALPAAGAGFGTRNDGDSRERGEAFRRSDFRGEISVRVVAVEPGGLLQVKGEKTVSVDKDRQEITLSGYVRPQDVSSGNVVESWRVGDAELVYSSKGSLGKPRGGILSRIVGLVWP